jgi:hypothetical protein
MSAATGFTQEQLTHFEKFVQHLVTSFGITGNKPFNAFLNKIRMIHGSPAINSDETRTQRFFKEISTGTVAAVSSAGAYTGIDFNTSRIEYEQLLTMEQMGATFSIAERNIAKLSHFIGTIDTTESGIKSASRSFITLGYGDIIKKEILNKIATKVKTDVTTALTGATVATVYGDTIYANSGTLLNIDNLVEGAFTETTLDTIYNKLAAQVDYYGNSLFNIEPAFFIVDVSKAAECTKIIKNSMTVNESHKNILDYESANGAIIVPLAVGSGEVYVFTDDPQIVLLAETEEPVVKISFDEFGNMVMRGYFIYKVGFKGRDNTIKVVGS